MSAHKYRVAGCLLDDGFSTERARYIRREEPDGLTQAVLIAANPLIAENVVSMLNSHAALVARAAELEGELENCSNALAYLAQETEARRGVPKPIIGGARHHVKQARAALAKGKGGAR